MKKQLIYFAAGLGMLVISTALLLFLPTFSVLYIPLMLALFSSLFMCEGKWHGILIALIGFLSLTFLSQSVAISAMCVLLPFVLSAVSASVIKKAPSEKTLTLVYGLANALFLAGIIFITKEETGGMSGLLAQITDTFNQNLDMFTSQGLIDSTDKETYISQLSLVLDQLKRMIPAILFVFSAIMGYISLWLSWLVSRLLKAPVCFKPSFSRFKCNTVTTGMTILICLLSIFIKDGVLGVALDNAFAIFSFLLCTCTASLADYWLKQKNWATIVRIIIVLFLLSNYYGSILSLLMCMIAIFDARADLRKLEH